MTAEQWQHICELFEESLAVPETGRSAWIRARTDDGPLRDAVIRMARSHTEDGDFLEQPVLRFAAERLGPWRTVREIGRGGMGIVFLGERADGLYQQQVAIKVAPGGIHTETALLARLRHPNIARLLDAGETASGFPYLVMEYVEGAPLDEWVRRTNPSQQQRLDVFRGICDAVQHAHQNLILHRDLKPSNVLIDGDGKPKLLDFGIARPLDLGATVSRVSAGTPEYASPEQLLAEPLTTASDVFSLGLLLHTILTGQPPRNFTGLSLREILDRVERREPLPIGVRSDLAQVIGKATHPDAGHRYGAAGQLAEEIRRYQAGLPVEARGPSVSYLFRRFVSRNRGKIAAGVLAGAALTSVTAIAVVQRRSAERRFEQVRRLARSVLYEIHDSVAELPGSNPARLLLSERALEYLEALSKEAASDSALWTDVASGYLRLGDVQGGSSVRNLGEYEKARESYARAKEIADRLTAANGNDPLVLRLRLNAERPLIMAKLRGSERKEALGLARDLVRRAEQFQRDFPSDAHGPRLSAEAHMLLGSGFLYNAMSEETLPQWLRTLAMFEKLPRTEYLHYRKVTGLHQYLCDEYLRRKNVAEARRHIERAVAAQEEALRLYPQLITARMDLSLCNYQYAQLLQAERKHEEAIRVLDRVIAARQQLVREEPTDVVGRAWLAGAYAHRGQNREATGRLSEAAADLRASLDQYLTLLDAEKTSQRYQVAVAETEAVLAAVLQRLSRHDDACSHYRSAAFRFAGIAPEAKAVSRNPQSERLAAEALKACGG